MEDLSNYRKSYEKGELLESQIPRNPFELFNIWFREVERFGGVEEPNAMTLSTIGLDGFPKSRVVLLKQILDGGFVFYTNYNSEKGLSLESNPNVCISFFWPPLERQVIIKAVAERLSEELSDKYFDSRPVGSKLGALVSNQSEVIASRAVLEQSLTKLEIEYKEKQIQRPSFWGGYVVVPTCFEFWQGRPNRLHDRVRFRLQARSWEIDRLSP